MEAIKLLMVEDTPSDAELILHALRKADITCESLRVETRDDYEQALKTHTPDLILSDLSLPNFDGQSALRIAHAQYPDIPFIFISGTITDRDAIESLKHGATDYLTKSGLERLGPIVRRALQERTERKSKRAAERALVESDRFARSTIDALSEQLCVIDETGTIVKTNKAWRDFAAINGGDPQDTGVGVNYLELCDKALGEWCVHAQAFAAGIRAVLKGERERFEMEYPCHAPEEQRWFLSKVTRFYLPGPLRVVITHSNITERKIQEYKIARLSRIQAVLSGINSLIVRVRDRDQLFNEACRIVVEDGKFRMAWIGLLNAETLDIRTVAHVGMSDDLLGKMTFSIREDLPAQRGLITAALRSRQAVICNDIANDSRPKLRTEMLALGCRSGAVYPLMVNGQPIGALALYATEAGIFTADEMKLLDELASDISFALDYLAKAEQLNYLAYYDALTMLPNRNLLHDRLGQAIAQAQRHRRFMAVLFIDLDRFKMINDGLGHKIGDEMLKVTAARLKSCLREGDTVARFGGDEFALVLSEHEGEDAIFRLMRRVLDTIVEPVTIDGHELVVSCCIGCSIYPKDGENADTLLRNADAAMYRAKGIGGSNFQFYVEDMNLRLDERLALERALRAALDRQELFVEYQPQAKLPSRRIVGAEALLRWRHPDKGLIPPAQFIPLAEESGLIIPIGEWVLHTACTQNKAWLDAGLGPIRISVNLSALQFRQKDIVGRIRKTLEVTGLPPQYLELEITEGMLVHDADGVNAVLCELHDMGISLALDDFGTGYSSLSYLKRFRVHRLKIDQSFVRDITLDPDDAAIAAAVISLGHALSMSVIAEGVETSQQSAFLSNLHCDEVQGYFFGRPMAASDFTQWLSKGEVIAAA